MNHYLSGCVGQKVRDTDGWISTEGRHKSKHNMCAVLSWLVGVTVGGPFVVHGCGLWFIVWRKVENMARVAGGEEDEDKPHTRPQHAEQDPKADLTAGGRACPPEHEPTLQA